MFATPKDRHGVNAMGHTPESVRSSNNIHRDSADLMSVTFLLLSLGTIKTHIQTFLETDQPYLEHIPLQLKFWSLWNVTFSS